ncbi:hypothetical protein F2Q69_00042661 [Brassica cretica]|uniref:Ubiquitin-like protease family profile domain-containing protein n=1 Tax=Brassica cretica TaxID=69181 RepID=A0A8S9NMA9_BRACR|nr:hypothetical protein F2Q69_00042661 [Brassica cretica]
MSKSNNSCFSLKNLTHQNLRSSSYCLSALFSLKMANLKSFSFTEVAQAEEEAVNEGSFLNFGIRVPISEFSNDDVLYVRVYIVMCSGDCEPVAIKFMELNALGNPHPRMDGMTDDLVDIMRKQFAMDYYKDGVVPVYVENETK